VSSGRPSWLLWWLLGCAALPSAQAAAPAGREAVVVAQAWARATPPGAAVGVAYFDVVNRGPADQLVAIDTPVAGKVEMHSSTMINDVMQMRHLESVPIAAGARVTFSPGGLHAMLLDLRAPLKEGQTIALTLHFRVAGDVRAEATVAGVGATQAPAPARAAGHAR